MPEALAMRVEAVVAAMAAQRPDHPALIFHEYCWRYAELAHAMDRRAAALHAVGLRPGDVVAMHTPVTADVIIALLACCRAGLPLLPLSAKFTNAEVAPLLARAHVRCILTPDGAPHPAASEIPVLPLALPGAPSSPIGPLLPGDAHAVAAIETTTGTTAGVPKLVQAPHARLTWRVTAPVWWEASDDVHFIPQPMAFTVRGVCDVFAMGATCVLSDAVAPATLEAEMAAHGVTILRCVPAMLNALVGLRTPPPDALRLRYVRTGSAPLSTSVRRAAEARYGAMILQEYGSNEGGPMIVTPPEGAPEGSVGKPLPGVRVRLVDESGADVRNGVVGSVLVQSPGAMVGYLDDPAATASVLRDGWVHTGDLAWRDADGYYFLLGRQALRINVGGFKVIPEEVEGILRQHPSIREAVVLPHESARWGQVVRAILVAEGEPPAVRDLRRFCRERLAPYKVPRVWEFRPDLPRSVLGKVLRHTL